MKKLDVVIVGGGMITQIQILPSVYQLQREGLVGDIKISALNAAPLKTIAEDKTLLDAFPGHSFTPYPDWRKVDPKEPFPDLFREVLKEQKPFNCVIVAVPDQFHYSVIKEALNADQHVCSVKPLVLKYDQAVEIEKLAREKGLLVGVEYHKRFDDRALIARRRYRAGQFGEFKVGQAHLVEKWYYRHSNFQNWCTCENSDAFTYIGCHYVDLVAFITGLKPKMVSVHGIVGQW
ncbi:MAG: Gfo/Idh/MocA family oxidoreductase, partial [Planctomycetota bacterium]|nr:Gfo/Idh/MocA family oxidoreductase [Planctomycetota bacterium]